MNMLEIFFSLVLTKVSKMPKMLGLCTEMASFPTECHRNSFSRFKQGKFEITDIQKSGRPVQFEENQLHALVNENPRLHVTVTHYLHSVCKVKQHSALTERNQNASPLPPVCSFDTRLVLGTKKITLLRISATPNIFLFSPFIEPPFHLISNKLRWNERK